MKSRVTLNPALIFVGNSKNTFLALLRRYRQRDGFRLYHYCLMDNHFHLLLQPRDPRQLSRLMAGILVAYARYFTRRHRFVGHLFQGRFKSPLVQRDGSGVSRLVWYASPAGLRRPFA